MSFDFGKFSSRILGEMALDQDETSFLKALSQSAGRYPDFVKILEENPTIEANLINASNQAYGTRLSESITSTDVALGMMGFIQARNFLVASIIRKANQLTPWDESIKQMLRFALEGEMIGGSLASRYFAAGFVFDFVVDALQRSGPKSDGPPALPKFVSDTWRHSLQVCSVSRQLVNRLFPESEIEKEICSHALLHDIGKLPLYFMDEEIIAAQIQAEAKRALKKALVGTATRGLALLGKGESLLESEAEGKRESEIEEDSEESTGPDRALFCFPERAWVQQSQKYGMTHDALGHMIVWNLGFFPDAHWIVLYHHHPYLAARRGKTVQMYTTLVWLSDQICRYREYHRQSRVNDRMITGWYMIVKPFLEDNSISNFKGIVNSLIFS